MKIRLSLRLNWMFSGLIADFLSAWMLMLCLSSLGIHWGYWHSWWITFTAGTAISTVVVSPILVRLETLIEKGRTT